MRPFEASENTSVFNVVKKGIFSFPDDVTLSEEGKYTRLNLLKTKKHVAIDLVNCMLNKDPLKRITAQQALEHPWITVRNLFSIPTILIKATRVQNQN